MLRKIALLIVVGIFSLSISSCVHVKGPFKPFKPGKPFKMKPVKKSELHLNTDVNSYAKFIKIMQEVEA